MDGQTDDSVDMRHTGVKTVCIRHYRKQLSKQSVYCLCVNSMET